MPPASSRWPTAAMRPSCSGSSRATARSSRSIASICRARSGERCARAASRSPCDRGFGGVITACADREETWINAELERAMLALHGSGHAHSVEIWKDGIAGRRPLRRKARPRLLRREHVQPRARRVEGRARLAGRAAQGRAISPLLDCQFMTEHLASLGAISVPRETYVALLSAALGGGVAAGAA